jgi:hypothetical protein
MIFEDLIRQDTEIARQNFLNQTGENKMQLIDELREISDKNQTYHDPTDWISLHKPIFISMMKIAASVGRNSIEIETRRKINLVSLCDWLEHEGFRYVCTKKHSCTMTIVEWSR